MKFGIRELLFVALMIGLVAASYFLVFRVKNLKMAERIEDDKIKLKTMADLHKATAGIGDLGRKIEELEKAISFFESKLPREKEVDKILKEVWQMAEGNSMHTKTIKTLKSEQAPGCREQPIQMTLTGDFNGFYSFLLQLEKMPRITRINQMKLDRSGDQEGQIQAQMTLSIFFEPESPQNKVAVLGN